MTILDQLAEYARFRVAESEKMISAQEIKERAMALPKGDFSFERALRRNDISFICECKKASPSKGLIAPDFPYLQIAREYEHAGVWSYLETPDTLTASSGALMIHAKDAGVKTIRLPGRKIVTDITLNRDLGECETFQLELKANETRIFLLDN